MLLSTHAVQAGADLVKLVPNLDLGSTWVQTKFAERVGTRLTNKMAQEGFRIFIYLDLLGVYFPVCEILGGKTMR